MKKKIRTHLFFSSILAITVVGIRTAPGQGTAFTYQGRLTSGGSAANGSYDLRFQIFDGSSGNGLVAGPLTNSVSLSNGL